MKKLFALLLTVLMLLSLMVPVMAEEAEEATEDETLEVMTADDTLVIGAPELNADYINGFGNSSYDVYIKYLIGNYGGEAGYATYFADEQGQFVLNPTVCPAEPEVTENEDGTKTYTYEIHNDLVWNDGEPITASDFVFGSFFSASPEWMAQGAQNSMAAEDIFGFDAYHEGETRVFEGLNVIDETHFSITLKAEKLPYFFETAMAAASPTPMHRYAPNLEIVGNELKVKEGYEITQEDIDFIAEQYQKTVEDAKVTLEDEQAWWEGYQAENEEISDEDREEEEKYIADLQQAYDDAVKFIEDLKAGTADLDPITSLMTKAALDVAYVYRFNPDVTCGPYKFVSYENRMAKVTLNELFKGNREGKLPTIKNVIVQTINNTLDMDLLIAGYVDIVPGLTEASKINKGKDSPDRVGYTNYPRNGYGLLAIRNDYSPTQYPGVRKAIAYSIDRDQFVADISGGYAIVVDGCFGIDQFEYVDRGEELESDERWNHYTLNSDMANQELDTTPFKFEKDGVTPWDPAKAQEMYDSNKEGFDYWRHDENGNELRIVHNGAQGIETTDLIQIMLPDNAKLCGMNYIVQPVDFATLLNNYYHAEPTEDATTDTATAFNMGNGFGIPDDKYYSYHSSQIGVGSNNDRINDPELDKIIETMRKADPSDIDTWENGWYDFQIWYNNNMPNIPLYANDYHDFFSIRLQGLDTTPMWDWYNDIFDLTLGEAVEVLEMETEEEVEETEAP